MLIGFILIICFIQGLTYYLIRNSNNTLRPFFVLGVFIISHLLLFPKLFIPEPLPGEDCGNPILGIYLMFIIFGVGLSIATHFVYPKIVPHNKE